MTMTTKVVELKGPYVVLYLPNPSDPPTEDRGTVAEEGLPSEEAAWQWVLEDTGFWRMMHEKYHLIKCDCHNMRGYLTVEEANKA